MLDDLHIVVNRSYFAKFYNLQYYCVMLDGFPNLYKAGYFQYNTRKNQFSYEIEKESIRIHKIFNILFPFPGLDNIILKQQR